MTWVDCCYYCSHLNFNIFLQLQYHWRLYQTLDSLKNTQIFQILPFFFFVALIWLRNSLFKMNLMSSWNLILSIALVAGVTFKVIKNKHQSSQSVFLFPSAPVLNSFVAFLWWVFIISIIRNTFVKHYATTVIRIISFQICQQNYKNLFSKFVNFVKRHCGILKNYS